MDNGVFLTITSTSGAVIGISGSTISIPNLYTLYTNLL